MDALNGLNTDQIITWLQIAGFKLVAALATFIIGRWVAKLLVGAVKASMNKARADATLISFAGNVIYGLLMAVVVISALGQMGVSTTSAAALLGGAGVAIGLALKDQLSAFAAGALMIVFRPFRVGDFIEAAGTMGTVEAISIVTTILKTTDNQEITLPNDQVWGGKITNYSIRPTRRIDLPVGISYEADFRKAKDILSAIAAEDERVLKDPAPWLGVTELADSAVIIRFRVWVNTPDFWQIRSDIIEQIKLRFDESGIGIPFPQMDVHLHKDAAAA